ncbi:hypothetical protein HQ35_03030 [Porphyromonas cangingivalis]|uniref:Uncharacterized protein n=1 Tax=Porphyromonas cangingivalis TaxID=36874 RepID=A0A0A2EWX5_PORCN|nr:hypothetical protein [Porphyromonas cangingivalis]KGN82217.1 hypothetical protein HQ35_03030 [Porphyromonas cangingivalis]
MHFQCELKAEVFNTWVNPGSDDQRITFELTDMSGNVQNPATDDRTADVEYARKEGTPVARRPLLAFKDGDTQKQGWLFEQDNGRVFSNDSYYVRTKAVKYFFGLNGQIQSPIIEIPPMPRVPLVKSIKTEGGKAIGEFEELDSRYTNRKIAKYVPSSGTPNLWVPEYEAFPNSQEINIAFTKENTAYTGKSTLGTRNFEFNVSSSPDDLVGLTVFVSSPFDFFPATPSEWARPKDVQIDFRPIRLGVIVKHEDKLRIKYENNLGFTETHVPLRTN